MLTREDLEKTLIALLNNPEITQSRGYFGTSTLEKKLQDFYKKEFPQSYKKWQEKIDDSKPIDTTLYLRY